MARLFVAAVVLLTVVSALAGEPGRSELTTTGSRTYLAVPLSGDRQVMLRRPADLALAGRISVPFRPGRIANLPSMSRLYVFPDYGEGTNAFVDVDLQTTSVVGQVSALAPYTGQANSDDTKLYVSNVDGGSLFVVNTSTDSVSSTLPATPRPDELFLDSVSNELYVADNGSSRLSVYDTISDTLNRRFIADAIQHHTVTGGKVYWNSGAAYVVVSTASSFSFLRNIETPALVAKLLRSTTGQRVYALLTDFQEHSWLAVIDVASDTIVRTYPFPGVAWDLVLDATESTAFVTLPWNDSIGSLDLASGALTTRFVGALPLWLDLVSVPCHDDDGDGRDECSFDCDDSDATVFPGGSELCDGKNNDCNDPLWPAVPLDEMDGDADGYRTCSGDCDDSNPDTHPGASERCDGRDDNCDGHVDEGFDVGMGCFAGSGDCAREGVKVCTADGTGTACTATPGTPRTLYRDQDGDGYGDPARSVVRCSIPPGFVTIAGDCNDASPAVHPGALEICNGIDDNCDGHTDEDAQGVDSDGDGVHNACDNCRMAYNSDQLDTDGDHFGNACDNCIFIPNSNQADTDSDGRGNACDNCPSAYNPLQDDSDHDAVGDVCDNCGLDYNPNQRDRDHDGEGDSCDLDDGQILILYADGPDYIEWQQEAGFTSWNVYEGDLDLLKGTGVYTQAPGSNPLAERHCGVTDTFVDNFDNPPVRKIVFSLVTGVANGVEGSLGQDSRGIERPNAHPCP